MAWFNRNLQKLADKTAPPLLIALTGFVLFGAGSAQAASFIDTFTDPSLGEQAVQRGGSATPTPKTILEQPGTATGTGFSTVIGGYRDLWLQGVTGNTLASTKTAVGSVSDGTLSFSNGPGVQSWLNVTWDGNDPGTVNSSTTTSLGSRTDASYNSLANANTTTTPRPVRRSGLGTQDLTNLGEFNSLAIQVLRADLDFAIQMRIYDTNGTGISEATYSFAGTGGVSKPTAIFFAFDQAAKDALPTKLQPFAAVFRRDPTDGSNDTAAARFTKVGAINMTLKALRGDVDAQIDLLKPENTRRFKSIPESNTSVLVFAGLTAFAALTTKKQSNLKK